MDDKSKAYVRHHWEQVQESTGQPFSFEFFERDGFVYDTDALAACAENVGVEADVFTALFESPEIAAATRADFSLSQSLGIPGFPTVVVATGQNLALLTSGYAPFESLKPPLEAWLAS